MAKNRKRIPRFLVLSLWGILVVLVTLAVILTVNTILYSSRQIRVAPIEKIAIDPTAVTRLSEAVQLPTISYPDRIDTSAFLQLDTLIRSSFPLVDSLLERLDVTAYSQVFRWAGLQSDMQPVLLLAHLDVVPVEAPGAWTYPPFSGRIADGYVWGRGSMDDKMSAFAILEAIETLLQEEYLPNRTIYLAFGHDEEINGFAGAHTISEYFARENLRFEYVLDEGQLILQEALAGLEPPLAMIGVAEKGSLTLELKVELKEGGHSSMPPPETAIGILSEAVVRLERQPFPGRIDGATRGLLDYIGPEMAPLYQTLFANLWLTRPLLINQFSAGKASNAVIRTTTAPTVITGGVKSNVLPTQARALVNFRILPGETVESVTSHVTRLIADERVSVQPLAGGWKNNPSPVSPTNTFGFGVIQKTIREIFPEVVIAPALVIAATDSRHYQEVSDQIYRFQPLYLEQSDLSRLHGIDERISVEGYENAIRFYRQLIRNSSL